MSAYICIYVCVNKKSLLIHTDKMRPTVW